MGIQDEYDLRKEREKIEEELKQINSLSNLET